MLNCFNWTNCLYSTRPLVYVYPDNSEKFIPVSSLYSNILRVIRESSYFTEDSTLACLFVLNIDTLDRDRIRFSINKILNIFLAKIT